MYANVRQYRGKPEEISEVMHLVDTELAERLSELPGFVAYECMTTDDGTVCSMTVFEDRASAERSQETAASFVREHLAHIELETMPGLTGEVMVSRARERILEATHH